MTIPADIREKAEAMVNQAGPGGDDRPTLVANIIALVMEQRERCAQIAERRGLAAVARVLADPKEKRACHESVVSAASAIASAIRNEGEQKT